MFDPVSTYRIQFHKNFTFNDLEQLLPYLEKMGIKTIYASPVFKAVPGSMHGYDCVDLNEINPEIGTLEQLRKISKILKEKGMCWLQDIVPNHMAFHHENKWLMDVLEKGKVSAYHTFFDINSDAERLLAPFLTTSAEEAISKKELKIVSRNKRLHFKYFDNYFPLNEASAAAVMQLHNDPETAVQQVNENPELLLQHANEQYYQLVPSQQTDKEINYRRFFTVNGLICLNINDADVFEKTHRFILSLLHENIFQGLRVDHVDGLYDPALYLERLRNAAGENAYIIVEKILEQKEKLPQSWPVQGTTGYDFLALANNLFTAKKSEAKFRRFYKRLTKNKLPVQEQIRDKKSLILHRHMAGELHNLLALFRELTADQHINIPEEELKTMIAEFLIRMPVYRFYGNRFPLSETETAGIKKIIDDIKQSTISLAAAATLFESRLLHPSEKQQEKAIHFYMRCMQFSGPLMAKGVEDTLMYTFNRFIAHNEVGDAPDAFGISAETFHREMIARQQQWPLSLNASATHDTKRGEDFRARLNVLTDFPAEWLNKVKEWQQLNAHLKINEIPDANDEYFIYQTLIGSFPLQENDAVNFKERLNDYLTKVLREAKTHSDWAKPDEAYEKATINFAENLLEQETEFWKSFQQFHQKLADYGIINSLSQLILKHSCPGIPDTFQGTELWDFSFVDPDNRKAVGYDTRKNYVELLENNSTDPRAFLAQLWQERHTGKIKLYFLKTLLSVRKQHSRLFEKGIYIPLEVRGAYKNNVFAFARRMEQTWYIIVLPLRFSGLENSPDFLKADWKNTKLVLPEGLPAEYENILLHTKVKTGPEMLINDLFDPLPFAILKLQHAENKRGAGILVAISSLPSPFGIGDLGPGAKVFANFLSSCNQKYWQLLPLNPTDVHTDHSPYSSISGMAGNTLLISPQALAQQGFLVAADLENYTLPETGKTEYEKAKALKYALFEKAYHTFKIEKNNALLKNFHTFCEEEAYWLNDFARYLILREEHAAPWHQWPEPYRTRDPDALNALDNLQPQKTEYIKWLQFIFHQQLVELKEYCNALSVQLIGDLPFYISHDSAEVWANPGIFSLEENGTIKSVAGVPPDYFSKTGQLWGMPTYRWDTLKQQDYKWWITRLHKNLQHFDLLRIDHFRALQAYWEVPAAEATAVNGEWRNGPAEDFFNAVQQQHGRLPFIAEDLGDHMQDVYRLRDAVQLPGMKVLQFAFGENMATTVDIPHNFPVNCIVYTGTHDNNTTLGWYRMEITAASRQRIEKYSGKKINEQNICDVLAAMAYGSVAATAIIPMQDLLCLDESKRMNTPGKGNGNWVWRLTTNQLSNYKLEKKLREWAHFYNRI